jgi:hypothetical protein
MKWDPTKSDGLRRAFFVFWLALALAAAPAITSAFTTIHFLNLQSQINNDTATLSALENPTREQRNLLRALNRASGVLAKTSVSDGKTLRGLNSILGRNSDYIPPLTTIASNLLLTFNSEYAFVGTLLVELPPSPAATVVTAHYNALAPNVEKLNAAPNIAKFSALYDATKNRLDAVFAEANEALIVPFPSDISPNSVKAKIDGITFTASSGTASENVTGFNAVVTETNISVVLHAIGSSSRGIHLAVPNAQPGTFRYIIPNEALFTNRTVIEPFTGAETATVATNGVVFISTTPTEVYGIFSCSGTNFNVTDGRFRITLSSQP